MSLKQLTSYAFLGEEFYRRQRELEEKVRDAMKNISDEEYEQMLELAKKTGDEQMVRDLPIMRAMVKK